MLASMTFPDVQSMSQSNSGQYAPAEKKDDVQVIGTSSRSIAQDRPSTSILGPKSLHSMSDASVSSSKSFSTSGVAANKARSRFSRKRLGPGMISDININDVLISFLNRSAPAISALGKTYPDATTAQSAQTTPDARGNPTSSAEHFPNPL